MKPYARKNSHSKKAKSFQYTREQTSEGQSKILWFIVVVIVAGFAYLFEASQHSKSNRTPASAAKISKPALILPPGNQNPTQWTLEREPRIR